VAFVYCYIGEVLKLKKVLYKNRPERESERESEKEGDRERERDRQREKERDVEYGCFIFKRNDRCLGNFFSYQVGLYCYKLWPLAI